MELFFPTECLLCHRHGAGLICARCQPTQIHRLTVPAPSIAHTYALAPYRSPWGGLLREAKIKRRREILYQMGRRLAEYIHPLIDPDPSLIIVPTPSPWTRKLRRGFNPSAIMAQAIASRSRHPLRYPLKLKPGVRQATLNKAQRWHNMQARISCRSMPPARILIVDDVVTTGATAESCGRALLRAGATEIILAVSCYAETTVKNPKGSQRLAE